MQKTEKRKKEKKTGWAMKNVSEIIEKLEFLHLKKKKTTFIYSFNS